MNCFKKKCKMTVFENIVNQLVIRVYDLDD